MIFSDDEEIFEFFGLLDGVQKGEGTNLLLEYWRRTGKLDKLEYIAGNQITAQPDELADVIAAQNVCEKLYVKLSAFLNAPCCTRGVPSSYKAPSDVANAANRLIGRLAAGFGSPRRKGWHAFYADLASAALNVTALIDEVLKLDAAGAMARFHADATPEDVLSGRVNYNSATGKHLVLGGAR